MTTELAPPSGFHYDGDFFPMTRQIAKALLDVETTIRMQVSAEWALSVAKSNGETDLFDYAAARRETEQKAIDAVDTLTGEIRKQFGVSS